MFIDALTLDAPRRTRDGYLAVRAKAARTGTYQYLGSEIDPNNEHGLKDAGLVNVLRDDKTVFDESSARSFIGKPITDDHPSEPVNAANWRDHARGMVMGAMRDGDYLAFDLLLTDAGAIAKVDGGKRELSNGYGADLEFGEFRAADGTACVARQTKITGNHVALVDKGRAGSSCAITDAAVCDAATLDVAHGLLAMLIDGGKKPYGDVEYADPGYQDDGKKRYPLDTEEHIRAAWSYINQKKSADQYSSDQVGKIKAKIVAAWKAKIDKAGPPSATGDGRTYTGGSDEHTNDPARRETSNPRAEDARPDGEVRMPHTLIIDGLQVPNVSDEAKAAIEKLQGQVKDSEGRATAADTKIGELTASVSTKDGEIAALNQKLKDAEVSPAKLEQLAADRAKLIATAKTVDQSIVTDGKSDAEIRKALVQAKLGDSAKDMDDAAVNGAFAVLTKDVKAAETTDALRTAIGSQPVNIADARAQYEKTRDTERNNLRDAWRRKPATAA